MARLKDLAFGWLRSQKEEQLQSSCNDRFDWNLHYNLQYYFWREKGIDMGSQTSLKTSQGVGGGGLQPPQPSP